MMHVLCCASLLAGDVSDARHVGGEPDKMCAWRLEIERKISHMFADEDAIGSLSNETLWGFYDVCDR
jgi:hypothetical protein